MLNVKLHNFTQINYQSTASSTSIENYPNIFKHTIPYNEQVEQTILDEIFNKLDVKLPTTNTIILDFTRTPNLEHILTSITEEQRQLYLDTLRDYFKEWLKNKRTGDQKVLDYEINQRQKKRDNDNTEKTLEKHKNRAEVLEIKNKHGSDVLFKGKKD